MNESVAQAVVYCYIFIDFVCILCGFIFFLTIMSFCIEPLRSLYALISFAPYDKESDIRYFLIFLLRLFLLTIALLLLRYSSVVEYVAVYFGKVVGI